MLKIRKQLSVNLSIVVAVLFIAVFAAIAAFVPFVWESTPYFSWLIKGIEVNNDAELGKSLFFAWFYVIFAVAEICCFAVLALLLHVRKGLVFTEKSVAYIRFVSWGCMFLSVLFLVGQFFHPLMFTLSLAAAFLGLCLRVVKNVIEQATAIKNEHDFTI